MDNKHNIILLAVLLVLLAGAYAAHAVSVKSDVLIPQFEAVIYENTLATEEEAVPDRMIQFQNPYLGTIYRQDFIAGASALHAKYYVQRGEKLFLLAELDNVMECDINGDGILETVPINGESGFPLFYTWERDSLRAAHLSWDKNWVSLFDESINRFIFGEWSETQEKYMPAGEYRCEKNFLLVK